MPAFGLGCVGRSVRDAAIVRDIYSHTIDVILAATALGGYRTLPEQDIFDVEYWDLEQAKLKKSAAPAVFSGEVALVTGAARVSARPASDSLLRRGAAVIALDVNADIARVFAQPEVLALRCDVTVPEQVLQALDRGVAAFGGLDLLVLNAGVFPVARASRPWRTTSGGA